MMQGSRKFDAASRIVAELHAAGYEAYLAGGCVRDLLLGCEPSDYDVATSATPNVVLEMFPRTFAVGAHFGVVLVATGGEEEASENIQSEKVKGEKPTEVATFRSDGAYSDGRHPDAVRYTKSAEEDVKRRDFTINGLLLDPMRGAGLQEAGPSTSVAAATFAQDDRLFSKLRMTSVQTSNHRSFGCAQDDSRFLQGRMVPRSLLDRRRAFRRRVPGRTSCGLGLAKWGFAFRSGLSSFRDASLLIAFRGRWLFVCPDRFRTRPDGRSYIVR